MKKALLLSTAVMSLSACDPVTLASVGTHVVKECIFPPPQILPWWWEDYCESRDGVKPDDQPKLPDGKPDSPKPEDPKDPPNNPPDGPGDPEPPDEPTTGKSRSGKADNTNGSAPAGDSGWNNPGKGNK